MTPEEHLLAAAEDMARYGLNKKAFFKRNDGGSRWKTEPACALGCLARTGEGFVNEYGHVSFGVSSTAAAHKLAEVIRKKMGWRKRSDTTSYDVITEYNDSDDVTAEDMIELFKEAARG